MPHPLIPGWPLWLEALLIPGALALGAYAAGRVSRSGALGGWVLASVIYACLGWRGMVVPLTFFILANLATAFGYDKKLARGIAQEAGGRRGAKHALANVTAGMLLAIIAHFLPEGPQQTAALIAYAATFATAAADTISSEIGQVLGRTPIHPLTFQRLEPGAEGAVSAEGTIAGVVGALLVALSGWAVGLPEGGWLAVLVVTLAAAAANWLESAVGSLWGKGLGNEVMNFGNTLAGGAIAWMLSLLLQIP